MKVDESTGVIRIENVPVENKPKSCCFCFDVRIGSIMIGLLYLVSDTIDLKDHCEMDLQLLIHSDILWLILALWHVFQIFLKFEITSKNSAHWTNLQTL